MGIGNVRTYSYVGVEVFHFRNEMVNLKNVFIINALTMNKKITSLYFSSDSDALSLMAIIRICLRTIGSGSRSQSNSTAFLQDTLSNFA